MVLSVAQSVGQSIGESLAGSLSSVHSALLSSMAEQHKALMADAKAIKSKKKEPSCSCVLAVLVDILLVCGSPFSLAPL